MCLKKRVNWIDLKSLIIFKRSLIFLKIKKKNQVWIWIFQIWLINLKFQKTLKIINILIRLLIILEVKVLLRFLLKEKVTLLV
jgi:hypothetical protein